MSIMQQLQGLRGNIQNAMGPDAGLKMSAIGDVLTNLSRGTSSPSPAMAALMARQERAERMRALEDSGVLQKFTPEQRQILSMMEPGAAQQIIASALFREPETPDPVNLQTFNGPDGTVYQFNPRTGETRPLTGAEAPEVKPNVIIASTPEDKATWGLPDDGKPYEVEYDPNTMQLLGVSGIGGGGVSVNQYPAPPAGFMYDFNAQGQPTGLKPIPGGPAEREAVAAERGVEGQIALAENMSDVIQQVIDDPALESITGGIQGRLPAGIPLLSGGQAGANLQPKIDQISGGAFLQAIDQLRGLGALSNIEGQTATQAIARLARIQDAEEYRAALTELKALIDGGIERLRAGRVAAPTIDDLTDEERAYLGLE